MTGKIVRSIDVGFGYTKFITGSNGNDLTEVGVFPSFAETGNANGFSRAHQSGMQLVQVEINGVTYAVGPDSKKTAASDSTQLLEETYFSSDKYLALYLGAMAYMHIDDRIDYLMVGLPIEQFRNDSIRTNLESRLTGRHSIPLVNGQGTKSVDVLKVDIVPQVLGSTAMIRSEMDEDDFEDQILVIDVGYGTFLWVVSAEMFINSKLSGQQMMGVSRLLESYIEEIAGARNQDLRLMALIERALRREKKSVFYDGRDYNLDELAGKVNQVIETAVSAMLRVTGDLKTIRNIYMVGGGAAIYQSAVEEKLNRKVIVDPNESQFSNVRGYQMIALAKAEDLA